MGKGGGGNISYFACLKASRAIVWGTDHRGCEMQGVNTPEQSKNRGADVVKCLQVIGALRKCEELRMTPTFSTRGTQSMGPFLRQERLEEK